MDILDIFWIFYFKPPQPLMGAIFSLMCLYLVQKMSTHMWVKKVRADGGYNIESTM